MSEKGEKKKTIRSNKKVSNDKISITLRLNNDAEISAKSIYKEDSRDIDIYEIKVSDKKAL